MNVLLDTNAYVKLAQGHAPLVDLLERTDGVFFSAVVLGELLAGFRLGTRRKENVSLLQDFLETEVAATLSVTADVADRYADIFTHLRQQGTPIPTNDIWIAATALEAGARLITYDTHYGAVPGLAVLAP